MLLKNLKLSIKRFDRVVYFDTTDSTGSIQTEIIDMVDIYCKNQLLKNKKEYLRPHYGMRIYSDYYHSIII